MTMFAFYLMACVENNLSIPSRGLEYNPHAYVPLEREWNVDRIMQINSNPVDVLFVIDNSGSMFNEQFSLIASLPIFIDYFIDSGLDYHVGVTTTETWHIADAGKLRLVNYSRWIDDQTKYPVETFETMAHVGINAGGDEQGFTATWYGLTPELQPFNEGFLRSYTDLHTIAISDEVEQTSGSVMTDEEFIAWYKDLRPHGNYTFNAIVDTKVCLDYMYAAEQLQGNSFDFKDNFSNILAMLGLSMARPVREFFLSREPVVRTIEVTEVTTSGVTIVFNRQDWWYDEIHNSINFNEYTPNPYSIVEIKYMVKR